MPLSERDMTVLCAAAHVVAAMAGKTTIDSGITAALLERVRQSLPSKARAIANRQARAILQTLGIEEETDA